MILAFVEVLGRSEILKMAHMNLACVRTMTVSMHVLAGGLSGLWEVVGYIAFHIQALYRVLGTLEEGSLYLHRVWKLVHEL